MDAPEAPSPNGAQTTATTGPIVCQGCKLGLEETSDSVVVSFGEGLWHVDCFRCAKCNTLVEHDTNLLLLADGSPVCENCSYVCSYCGQSISNEAIVTGDESYHADCFRCKSCDTRIEELVFAKTTQGIYCMACHNERVARTRKHAEAKRNRSLRRTHRDKDRERERGESTRDRQASSSNHAADTSSSSITPLPRTSRSHGSHTSHGHSSHASTAPDQQSSSAQDPNSPPSKGDSRHTNDLASQIRAEAERGTLPDPPVSLKKLRSTDGHNKSNGQNNDKDRDRSDSLRPGPDGFGTYRSRSDPTSPHARQRSTSEAHTSDIPSPSKSDFGNNNGHVQQARTAPQSPAHSRSNSSGAPPLPTKPVSSSSSFDTPYSSQPLKKPSASEGSGLRAQPSGAMSAGLAISRSTSPSSNFSPSPRSASPALQMSSPVSTSFSQTQAGQAPPRSSSMENNNSLLAPKASKAANRRSGFYGVMNLSSPSPTSETAPLATTSEDQVQTSRKDTPSSQDLQDDYFVVPRSFSSTSSANIRVDGVTSESESDYTGQLQPTTTISRLQTPQAASDTEMHNSASFYDPDVLVFLEAVNDPNSLKRSSTALMQPEGLGPQLQPFDNAETPTKLSSHYADGRPRSSSRSESRKPMSVGASLSPSLDVPDMTPKKSQWADHDDEQELLSPVGRTKRDSHMNGLGLSTGGRSIRSIPESGEVDGAEAKTDEAVKKVRESIRRSRGGSLSTGSGSGLKTNSGMTLDVELVELLLSELEQTKNKMKDLQKNYNAIRRASRQAFEGFSMAREEYDREVAARRDAEFEMLRLKDQMKEQASKLGALDELHKKQELLQRRSNDLRNSVLGYEQELSKMRVERDMTVAEMEELAGLPKSSDEASLAPERLSVALNSRLSSLKEEYRSELQSLTSEREALRLEVEELKQSKELFTEESGLLNKRNTEIADETAEAIRNLEAIKLELAQAQNLLANLKRDRAAALRSGSPSLKSSVSSTTTTTGTTSAMSQNMSFSVSSTRQQQITPTPPVDDQPTAFIAQKVEQVFPQATVRKFKWGSKKGLERPLNQSISKHPGQGQRAPEAAFRQHSFQPTSILRPVRCEHCGDKIWGMGELRCQACGLYCHTKCIPSYHIQCNSAAILEDPSESSTSTMFGNDLVAQCLTENRLIPSVVVRCIEAVEATAMEHEGIYRKSGGMGQTKLISSCFDRGEPFDLQDNDRFNDISAVTSVLKNYFRNLPNPLYTFEFHEDFCSLPAMRDADARLHQLQNLLRNLPEQHYATLKLLMMHLHRIHRASNTNKMTPANLGVVFGPTLLRSPDPSQEFAQMHLKARVVELTVENAPQVFSEA